MGQVLGQIAGSEWAGRVEVDERGVSGYIVWKLGKSCLNKG